MAEAEPARHGQHPARPWTGARIAKRIAGGLALLAVGVGCSAWLLHSTTDAIAEKRETRLAAAATWAIVSTGDVTAPTLASRDLTIVRAEDDGNGATSAQTLATQIRALRQTAQSERSLILAWITPRHLVRDRGQISLVTTVAPAITSLATAGADGVLIDIGAFASEDAAALDNLAAVLKRARADDPSLLVAAIVGASDSAAAPLDALVDGYIHLAADGLAPAGGVAGQSSLYPVILRDFTRAHPTLVLALESTDAASGTGADRAFDFVPRTRMP